MATYDVMQDLEFEVFGMDRDWEVEKERVYDQLNGIAPVSDLINTSDSAQPIFMRHSTSMPMAPLSFSPTWSASLLSESYGQSLPETLNCSPNPMEHLDPTWTVPALQYSSYSSSLSTETHVNGLLGAPHVQSAVSPSPDFDVSSFLRPHSGPQHWSEDHSVSQAESNASFDTTYEEQHEPPIERFDPFPDLPEASSPAVVRYQIKSRTKRISPDAGPGKKNPRGRKGPLKTDQRKATHEMRSVGACQACRDRKTKCDKGMPCRSCINYYKCGLVHNPCRGRSLDILADEILLCGNIFPKDRGLFCLNLYKVDSTFTVYLEVGFGRAFAWPAQLLTTQHGDTFPTELRHSHIVYPWIVNPVTRQNESPERVQKEHWVFPAVLADTSSNLVAAVDKHIESLLDDPTSFQMFPLFRSPLKVLKTIYPYYKQSLDTPKSKQLLRQVLKLLITIHICGDIKISPSTDSQAIINNHFPNVHHSHITPCFIRSQLGTIFKEIASKLMKEVLTSLELHCLDKSCAHFPLVICTFAVLFMSVESIHYHAARDSYHANHNVTHRDYSSALAIATPEDFEKSTGVKELLTFYRACFSKCHSERLSGTAETSSVPVVESLRNAVESARTYLEQRSRDSVAIEGNITIFFDRLLARLFLGSEQE